MRHVALIRPAFVASRKAMGARVLPPLGPAYIAAALERAGHRVTVIDGAGEAPRRRRPTVHPYAVGFGLTNKEIVERLPADVDVIGVSVMFSIQWPDSAALLDEIHRRFPGVPIILGGEHVTATWSYLLETRPEVSVCVLGEGDDTAVDVLEWVEGKRALESIAGIGYRLEGRPHRSSARARMRDMARLPRPAWHLFPIENYLSNGLGSTSTSLGRSMPILATRGCPFECTFCSSPQMWTTRYYVRPVADVVDEIEGYVARYKVTNIDFEDLTPILRADWILEFGREVERRGLELSFQFANGTRSEVLDEDVLSALVRAGWRYLTYAPDSGSERVVKRVRKKVDLDKMLESMEKALRLGLVVRANMIIGYPFETRADILASIRFCLRLAQMGVEDIPLFPFCPYPGSELYDELRSAGRLPPLGDEYFASLAITDFSRTDSYCAEVGSRELHFYRIAGMSSFILAGYLSHPGRILRTVRNVAQGRPASSVEGALVDTLKRLLSRASEGDEATTEVGSASAGFAVDEATQRAARPAGSPLPGSHVESALLSAPGGKPILRRSLPIL